MLLTWCGSSDKESGTTVPQNSQHTDTESHRELGEVKFFNAAKRFGFVALADGREVFVHASEVSSPHGLRRGDQVSLVVGWREKGWAGTEVALMVEAPAICFEPPDAAKGDLARVLFYVSVRYMGYFNCCVNDAVSAWHLNSGMEETLRR